MLDRLIQSEGDPDLWHSWAFDPTTFIGEHEYLEDPRDKRPKGPLDHWDAKRMLVLQAAEDHWQALEQGLLDYCQVIASSRYVVIDGPADHPYQDAINPDLLTTEQVCTWPSKREWVQRRKRDLATPAWALALLAARSGDGDIRHLRIESRSWLPQLITFLHVRALPLVAEQHIGAFVLADLMLRAQLKDGLLPSTFPAAVDSALQGYQLYRPHALATAFNDFPEAGTS